MLESDSQAGSFFCCSVGKDLRRTFFAGLDLMVLGSLLDIWRQLICCVVMLVASPPIPRCIVTPLRFEAMWPSKCIAVM